MKRVLGYLVLALLATVSVLAQPARHNSSFGANKDQEVSPATRHWQQVMQHALAPKKPDYYAQRALTTAYRMESISLFDGKDSVKTTIIDSTNAQFMVSDVLDTWDSASVWQPDYRWRTYYDIQGNDSVVYFEDWDTTLNNWVFRYKDRYIYDASNRLMETYATDGDSSYFYHGMVFYSASGQIDSMVTKEWDTVSFAWMPHSKTDFQYTNGKISKIVENNISTDAAGYYAKRSKMYSYNSQSKIISVLDSTWKFFSPTVLEIENSTITYNSNNYISQINLNEKYYFDGSIYYDDNYKFEFTYDVNNNLTFYKSSYYDTLISAWQDEEAHTNTYNSLIYSDITSLSFPFIEFSEFSGIYYDSYFLLEPDLWFGVPGTNLPVQTIISYYDSWDSTWYDGYSIQYSYNTPLSVAGQSDFDVQVAPNPAAGHVTFSWGNLVDNRLDLVVTDLSGRTLLMQPVVNGEATDISALHTGLFLYQLHDASGKQVHAGKLVKNE